MNIPLIIDIILATIFIACVYNGAKNGFIRAVASLLASVVALCASLFVTMRISPAVAESVVNPWIASSLEERLAGEDNESALETVNSLISTVNKVFVSLGDLLETEEETETADSKAAEEEDAVLIEEADTVEALSATIAAAIGNAVTAILLFIILFALFLAVLRVLIDQLRFINKIPIVGPANVLLGMALGAVSGAIFLMIPVWLIETFVPSIFGVSAVIDPTVLEQSRILAFVMKITPW